MNQIVMKDVLVNRNHIDVLSIHNLVFKTGDFVTILGSSGSGKTTFIHTLSGMYPFRGTITVDYLPLDYDRFLELNHMIAFVNNVLQFYIGRTVFEEIFYRVGKNRIPKDIIEKRINLFATMLGLYDKIKENPIYLSKSKKTLLSLLIQIINIPKILIIEDLFSLLDKDDYSKVYEFLKFINKKYEILIIHFSSYSEDCLYGNETILLKNGKILKKGKTSNLIKSDKFFFEANLKLPFMADLSNRLSYYSLLKEPILDMREMVRYLWKLD